MPARRFFQPPNWARVFGLALSFVALACEGGQTGGEDTGNGFPADSPCNERVQAIALDDARPLGFSGAEVLASLPGPHTAALYWNASTQPLTLSPEQGESRIELSIEYTGGRVLWLRPPASSDGGAASSGLGCPGERLEIEVLVELKSAGGALDERFATRLRASGPQSAQLDHSLPLAGLSGALVVTAPPGISATLLSVNAWLDEQGFRGALSGSVTEESSQSPGSASGRVITYAEWPAPGAAARP
jgi:hypothetical protein